MEQNLYKLRLHFFYCTIILVLTIIAIASDRWTLQPRFTEYLGNAATMTSLVLGLVAIFYSFISNDGLSKSLGSLGSVSESISSVRDQVVRQIEHGEETAREVHSSAKLIERTSIKLESSLSSLQDSLLEISSKTQELHGALGVLPEKIDALDAKILNSGKESPTAIALLQSNDAYSVPYTMDHIKRFLRLSSLESNLLSLACTLANEKNKPLVVSEMRKAIPYIVNDEGLEGLLQCMNALNLISLKEPFELESAEIMWVHPLLVEAAPQYISSYIESFRGEHSVVCAKLDAAVEGIRKMFA